MTIRPAAVAGRGIPRSAGALAREVDGYLDAAVPTGPPATSRAVIAPHAGIMFSGPVAPTPTRPRRRRHYDVAVLVGPSHFVGFDGRGALSRGRVRDAARADARSTRRQAAAIAAADADRARVPSAARPRALARDAAAVSPAPAAGRADRAAADGPADAPRPSTRSPARWRRRSPARRALLVASTDLSHYFDAATAGRARRPGARPASQAFDSGSGCSTSSKSYPEGGARALRRLRRRAGDRGDDGGTGARRARGAGAEATRTPARSPATTPASSATWPRRSERSDAH